MRVGYGRVSSRDQHLDVQQQRLEACCERVYLEVGSGTTTAKRPRLHELLTFVREHDVVVVCKLDRLARSTLDLYQIADQLTRKRVALEVLDQPMDPATVTGKVLFGMLSLMAEFETTLRRERQREGILVAQAKGVHFGRAKRLTPEDVVELQQARASGVGVAALTTRYGMTRTSIYRYLAEKLPLTTQEVA